MKVKVEDVLASYPEGFIVWFSFRGLPYYFHLGKNDDLGVLVREKVKTLLEGPRQLDKLRQEWVGKEIEV